ncbi:hypothetical protein B4166_2482 [Caldibacillus thermoamylovorans]|nr:hypothetical protein B4166_2482 [Caldibacillus thermoamylovorans]
MVFLFLPLHLILQLTVIYFLPLTGLWMKNQRLFCYILGFIGKKDF